MKFLAPKKYVFLSFKFLAAPRRCQRDTDFDIAKDILFQKQTKLPLLLRTRICHWVRYIRNVCIVFPYIFCPLPLPGVPVFFSSLAPDSMAPLAPQICPEDQSPSSAMSPQPRGAAKCILVEHPMVSPPSVNSHKTWDAKNICCHTCTILQYIAIYGDSTKYYNFTIYHIY